MMNTKTLPENDRISEIKLDKRNELESIDIFKTHKNEIRFLTAITLPLILAACGGGGGGGAVSPTPDSSSGGSS